MAIGGGQDDKGTAKPLAVRGTAGPGLGSNFLVLILPGARLLKNHGDGQPKEQSTPWEAWAPAPGQGCGVGGSVAFLPPELVPEVPPFLWT